MSELVRTCKRCGRKYTGWNCPQDSCRKARAKRNASSARSRARNCGGGHGRSTRFYTGAFHWSAGATIGPINADACPKQDEPETGATFPDFESRPEW